MTSLVRYIKTLTLLWGLLLLTAEVCSAQSEKVFSITEFVQDQSDLSGIGSMAKRVDGSGDLYAIVKVSSDDPEDKLSDYRFDFGMLNSIMEMVDGELWLYVQKNAKQVSVSRPGFKSVHRFDLGYTLESGAVYRMKISVKKKDEIIMVGKETVVFQITPRKSGIVITYSDMKGNKSLFGVTDKEGRVAKYIELGRYSYEVVADYYHKSEGVFTLDSANGTHIEEVELRPNYADIELFGADEAEIFIDGTNVGFSSWKGVLSPGSYHIVCKKENHKPTSQYVEIEAGQKYQLTLDAPLPIEGTFILLTSPLGASVEIDGEKVGETPLTMDKILIGSHSVSIFKKGYKKVYRTIYIEEGETLEENITLKEVQSSNESSSSNGYKSKNYRKKDPLVTFGVEAGADIGTTWTAALGALIRIGRYDSNFQLIFGGKYQYFQVSDFVSFRYESGPNSYDYGYANTYYIQNVHQIVVPISMNLGYKGLYIGMGYEHGFLIANIDKFKSSSADFDKSLFYESEEYLELKESTLLSRDLVLNLGFCGRHFDWRLYYKIGLKKDAPTSYGTAIAYYF